MRVPGGTWTAAVARSRPSEGRHAEPPCRRCEPVHGDQGGLWIRTGRSRASPTMQDRDAPTARGDGHEPDLTDASCSAVGRQGRPRTLLTGRKARVLKIGRIANQIRGSSCPMRKVADAPGAPHLAERREGRSKPRGPCRKAEFRASARPSQACDSAADRWLSPDRSPPRARTTGRRSARRHRRKGSPHHRQHCHGAGGACAGPREPHSRWRGWRCARPGAGAPMGGSLPAGMATSSASPP